MNQTNQIAAGTGKPATGVQQEFLTFTLGQEEYGIEILKVMQRLLSFILYLTNLFQTLLIGIKVL